MAFPDLPFLPTFVAIYELGNVTAAATQLHRTQPTLSYQLAQLETAVGAPLFVRQGRSLVPTELATQLHRLATGFARDLDAVRRGGAPDTLDIASVSGFGRFVLFPQLRRLRHAVAPPPSITLRFPPADEVFRRVADAEVDVGFSYRAVTRPRLVVDPVYTEQLVLVANTTWARRLHNATQFRDAPIITYDESDYVIGRWLGHHFGRRAPVWSSVAHFEELEEVLDLVSDGAGVAIVPSFVLGTRWKLRTPDWGRPAVENTIFAVRRVNAPPHRAVAELLAALRA
jgi:LysR family cyn operon transcriptional activator